MNNANKKIGIFTFHRAFNYGAVWQCYALKCACESLGYKVETIDYNPQGDYRVSYALHHRPMVAFSYLARMVQFGRFVRKYLNPTVHAESHEWIKQNPPQDDIYIVGSDQVWSTVIVGKQLDSYLLDFAPAHVKRISYAASTGGNPLKLNEYQLSELRKFMAISLREKQSVPDIQSKVNIPVTDVCDPSLLLPQEDYQKLEQKPLFLPKHYVAYLDLDGDSFCEKSARLAGKILGLPIVNFVGKYKSWAYRNYLVPSPGKWLYILHHADFICTNSFHGIAFSIIFKRPFMYCATQDGGRSILNERIRNLLNQVHLPERYIVDASQVSTVVASNYNLADSEKSLKSYADRSLNWLKSVLKLGL